MRGSTLASMVGLIERAQTERPPQAVTADRFASRFVLVIVLLSAAVAAACGGEAEGNGPIGMGTGVVPRAIGAIDVAVLYAWANPATVFEPPWDALGETP